MLNQLLPKLKEWCYHSATVAWGYIKIFAGLLLLVSHELFDYLSDAMADTDVRHALDAMNFPAYVGLGLVIIGFITLKARFRKKSEDPLV